jgi:phospholipase/carboxylesterase
MPVTRGRLLLQFTGVAVASAAVTAAVTIVAVAPASLPERFADAVPLAEAIVEDEGPAWPPAPSTQAPPSARARDAGPSDGGPAAAPASAPTGASATGPAPPTVPRLPELPPDTEALRVRSGELDGLLFLEHVIGVAAEDQPLPLVVVLHGRGDSARIVGGPFLGLTLPVRVIVPQAPDPLGEGYQWLPVRVGQGLIDRLSSTLFQTASRLARFIRSLERTYPVEGRAIVTGFSQGGLIALTLALYHDDVVGTALPLASWLPPPLEPSYRRDDLAFPRIRSMHGDADRIIPVDQTQALYDRLDDRGFDVDLVVFPGVEHVMSDPMNTLFAAWLDQAICEAVADFDCVFDAEQRARAALGEPLVDGGIELGDGAAGDAGLDAGPNAVLDAGRDAGRRGRVRTLPAVP